MSAASTTIARDVAWLPPLPSGWKLRPLWSMFERIKDVDHPDEQMLSVFRDYGVIAKDSRENLNQTAENRSIYQLVHPGWLVTNRMKAWQGSVGISPLRGIVSGHYICFAPRHSEDPKYLNWLFRSPPYAHAYALLSRGVRIGQVEIDNDEYRLLPVLLPPLSEQRAIAKYLDRETARSDTLIEEQQRLIEMLEERRESVVDMALTHHGFEIPCRFEDYEGTLPSGWRLVLLGQTLRQLTNGFVGPTRDILVDEGIRYIQSTHIKSGRIDFDRRPFYVSREWHAERPRIHLRQGDVLIVQTGDIGKVAVVPPDFGECSCHALQIARVRPEMLSGEYLAVFLSSRIGYQSLLARATGATHPHLEAGIRSAPIVVPPQETQTQIVEEVATQFAKIDTLIAETEKFIELARERRSALITAAVTGQIDVREVA